MHHFNYRVVQGEHEGEPYFEIREVWYNKAGDVCAMGTGATEPIGDTFDELVAVYRKVLSAFEKPVLVEKGFKFAPDDPDDGLMSSESTFKEE